MNATILHQPQAKNKFSPEDSTLGDSTGLSPAGTSSADPEVVSERGERFGLP